MTEIRDACDVLFSPGQVVEVRALGDSGTFSGYYSDYDKLAADAEKLDATPQFKGIYITLNPVNPALLARKVNRISRHGKTDASTSDQDITRRSWFPVDIDPIRPSGISSSNQEHGEALFKAQKIKGFLQEMGWSAPVLADSGNGAHLLFRIDLPNDAESTQLVKDCLTVLSQFFTDEKSAVDIANHNASRIWKLYGTVSRKGDCTEDRPHRRSEILFCPDTLEQVKASDLMLLASLLRTDENKRPNNPNDHSSTPGIDLGSWLSSQGLAFEEKPYSGGRLFALDDCPFSGAHKDGAYAIQFSNGAIFAGCHHNSCGGGKQRWSELREMFERRIEGSKRPSQMTPEEFEGKRKNDIRERAKAKSNYFGEGKSVSEAAFQDGSSISLSVPDLTVTASGILREGKPIEYLLSSFAEDHEGDDVVAKCLIMSFASRSVINSNGLHVLVTGESGKGKSHAFDTMLKHIPQECRLDGRMSDKALFYAEDLRVGSAICLDDVTLSEAMQETLKGVTTSFKKPFVYRTVNKDRKGQTCIIPERCVWWVAKMDGTGDDQVWNRMLTCWIDDSPEQDEKVLVRELEAAEQLPSDEQEVRDETRICQSIWQQLPPVFVVIPFAKRIRFSSSANRRNPGMLLDLVKSVAALHQYQRERITVRGVEVIYANTDDFKQACMIYQALNGESGGQMSKLTRSESDLIAAIRKSGKYEFTMEDLQDLVEKSYSAIRKLIHGGTSHNNHYSGLLEKCPAISFLDRTDITDGGETSKRQRVYLWDEDRYDGWASGGGCWLSNDDDTDDGGDVGTWRNDSEDLPPPKDDDNGTDSDNNSNNNNYFLDLSSKRNNESIEQEGESGDPCDSAIPGSAFSAVDEEPVTLKAILGFVPQSKDDLTDGKIPSSSEQRSCLPPSPPHSLSVRDIDPDDYHPINGVWSGPCAICGGKWVQYVEKVTPQMKAEGRLTTRKICEKCREKAKREISKTFSILPGTVNISEMEQVHTPRSRCDVCHQGEIKWYDRENQLGLCEVCYSQERARFGAIV